MTSKFAAFIAAFLIGFNLIAHAEGVDSKDRFSQSKFSVNFRGTPLGEALRLIAAKGHMQVRMNGNIEGEVNLAIRNSTLEEAMNEICDDLDLVYQLDGKTLVVSRKAGAAAKATASSESRASGRHPANEGEAPGGAPATAPASPTAGREAPRETHETRDAHAATNERPAPVTGLTYRSVPVLYANVRDVIGNVQRIMQPGESVVSDEMNNALIVYSGLGSLEQIKSFLQMYDRRPTQILIEAQIVETSKSFAKALGLSWGDPNVLTNPAPTGAITNPSAGSPNIILRGLLGSIDGRTLEANLTAAESHGDAKIVSRPKVFTLNNRKATIHSGLTYNIKTLSGVSTSSSSTSSSSGQLTGGVTTISSGLDLQVTPTVVGDGLVRMIVKVQNSEPDAGSSVDGIPGLNDNSAETAILVKGGQTATMAGLVKNNVSKTNSGVPWLSHVPVIGWLFSSKNDSDVSSELMIFLTPNIVDVTGPEPKVANPPKEEREPASVNPTSPKSDDPPSPYHNDIP